MSALDLRVSPISHHNELPALLTQDPSDISTAMTATGDDGNLSTQVHISPFFKSLSESCIKFFF